MNHKNDVQKQFGKSANSYVDSPIHKLGKDLQKLLNMASLKGNECLLDVATGGGHTANAFAPLVKEVTAVDLTGEMLSAAEQFIKGNGHENVRFVQGDAEKMPFSNGEFDVVTCRIAPHHFPHVENFIKESYRVLKPEGQFLLDDNVVPEDNEFDHFYNSIEKMRDYSHFRAWKKTEWLKMLEMSGFEIFEWHRFEKVFLFEPWCKRMQLSVQEVEKLNNFILTSSEKIKDKFKIIIENNQVVSFQGEALLLKAIKS